MEIRFGFCNKTSLCIKLNSNPGGQEPGTIHLDCHIIVPPICISQTAFMTHCKPFGGCWRRLRRQPNISVLGLSVAEHFSRFSLMILLALFLVSDQNTMIVKVTRDSNEITVLRRLVELDKQKHKRKQPPLT